MTLQKQRNQIEIELKKHMKKTKIKNPLVQLLHRHLHHHLLLIMYQVVREITPAMSIQIHQLLQINYLHLHHQLLQHIRMI